MELEPNDIDDIFRDLRSHPLSQEELDAVRPYGGARETSASKPEFMLHCAIKEVKCKDGVRLVPVIGVKASF